MIKSYERGWRTILINGSWFYEDNGLPVTNSRACKRCGMKPVDGRDACMGFISNIKSACCGHGVQEPYLIKENDMDESFGPPRKRPEPKPMVERIDQELKQKNDGVQELAKSAIELGKSGTSEVIQQAAVQKCADSLKRFGEAIGKLNEAGLLGTLAGTALKEKLVESMAGRKMTVVFSLGLIVGALLCLAVVQIFIFI